MKGYPPNSNAAVGCPLDGKLVDHRAEVGRIVFREISHVGTQLDAQHLRYLELQIEVGEEVPGGQGQHFLVAAVLIGDDVLPVQRTQTEVLVKLGRHDVDVARFLIDARLKVPARFVACAVVHPVIGVVLYLLDGEA